MAAWIAFAAVSVGFVFLSRDSLWDLRAHGFYRFWAFEALAALTLHNLSVWFDQPLSPAHLLAWALLLGSLLLAGHGLYLLRVAGAPQGAIENTTRLVTKGAFHYVRHPLYTSLLLFGLGVFLKRVSLLSAALMLAAAVLLCLTALAEERELARKFGAEYVAYMKCTKRFVPFIF